MSPKTWLFYIELADHEQVYWRDLTQHQAEQMYNWTDKHLPPNVAHYGYYEEKK